MRIVQTLRIWDILEALDYEYLSEGMLMSLDFTLLGLEQVDWTIKRGRRENRYYYNDKNELVVEHLYNYEYTQSGNVKNYTQTINWYNKQGQIGLTKNVNVKKGSGSITRLNRTIRQNQIDFLIEEGENLRYLVTTLTLDNFGGNQALMDGTIAAYLDVANSLDFLVKYFDKQINLYILRGIKDFENNVRGIIDGIINEPEVKEKLLKFVEKAPSEKYPNVKRVYNSILEQIVN